MNISRYLQLMLLFAAACNASYAFADEDVKKQSEVSCVSIEVEGKNVAFSVPTTFKKQAAPLAWTSEGPAVAYQVLEAEKIEDLPKTQREFLLKRSLKLQEEETGVRKVFRDTIDKTEDGTPQWYFIYYSIVKSKEKGNPDSILMHASRTIPLTEGKFIMLEWRTYITADGSTAREKSIKRREATGELRDTFYPVLDSLKVK